MKIDIHPKYNTDTKVTCACGAKFVIGSTMDSLSVEICSKCHPFYTGKSKLIDTAGRVDIFKKRMKVAEEKKAEYDKKMQDKQKKETVEEKMTRKAKAKEEVKIEEKKKKEESKKKVFKEKAEKLTVKIVEEK